MGRYDLQLSEQEFWHLVPRQFVALMKRRHERALREEYGPAMIVAALSQMGGSKKAKPTQFMPSWKDEPKREIPWQEQLSKVRELHSALGGT